MPRNSNAGKSSSGNGGKYNSRRWYIPSKRAKSYADERRAKVHQHGPKEGKELTDYEAGIRSGYLQCQTDHSGIYKYKKALAEGKSKQEARDLPAQRQKLTGGSFKNGRKEEQRTAALCTEGTL